MQFGHHYRAAGRVLTALGLSAALAIGAGPALAQAAAAPRATTAPATEAPVAAPSAASAAAPVSKTTVDVPARAAGPEPLTEPGATAAATATPAPVPLTPAEIARTTVAPGTYIPMKPTAGKGMPVDGGYGFQTQYSPDGQYARWMHDGILLPMIVAISLVVLFLLLWTMFRFNKRSNPVPSRTSHNTLIEIIWTVLPIVLLLVIFVPSMKLLGKQFRDAPAKALTVKVTGNQWFWTYAYPDNGGIEVISNMLPDAEAKKRGEPGHLAVDNRMVVPVGEPIRIQTTGADVIHSFAVPSLWFKIDAVPGRINERVMFIKEPGVYYGQCSELCGARHGYMPIAVEALPRPEYNRWVMAQGGSLDGLPKPVEPAAPAPAAAAAAPAAGATPPAGAAPAPAASASASATPAPAA